MRQAPTWVLVATFLGAQAVNAAEAPGLLDRLSTAGVEVRKSFSGTLKDSSAPAGVSYENPDEGKSFYAVDVGVKTKGLFAQNLSTGLWGGALHPTFELHQSSKEGAKVKKAGAGLTLQTLRGFVTHDEQSEEEDDFGRTLFAETKVEVNRDSELDQTTRGASIRLGYYDVMSKFGPGRYIEIASPNFLILRWLATAGAEDYRKIAITTKVDGETVVVADDVDTTQGFGRLNLLLIPFGKHFNQQLQLTGTYTLRHRISGDDFFGKTTRLIEASVDYYLDEDDRLAIGLTYQRGRDPLRNFLDEEFSSLGFKLKL